MRRPFVLFVLIETLNGLRLFVLSTLLGETGTSGYSMTEKPSDRGHAAAMAADTCGRIAKETGGQQPYARVLDMTSGPGDSFDEFSKRVNAEAVPCGPPYDDALFELFSICADVWET